MSMTTGKHTLKWGADFRRRQLTVYQTNQGNGRLSFRLRLPIPGNGSGGDTMASFLLGYPTPSTTTPSTGPENGAPKTDCTLPTMALQPEADLEPGDAVGLLQSLQRGCQSLGQFQYQDCEDRYRGQKRGRQIAGMKPYYKNFGPRLGFAYQIMPHTVVRGGALGFSIIRPGTREAACVFSGSFHSDRR